MKQYLFIFKFTMVSMMLFLTFSCEKSNSDHDFEDPNVLESNLLESSDLFATSIKERDSEHVFEIVDIKRKNSTLQVKVKGGGEDENFRFIWDGQIQESYPMGIKLVLTYEVKNEDFDSDKEHMIPVNLQKIIENIGNIEDFRFSIINGSKIQNKVLNPDGVVSDGI